MLECESIISILKNITENYNAVRSKQGTHRRA